jgi:hypothetical protein
MPKEIRLEPHLSSKELEERYRGAKDPILRSHYQIIWLIRQGKTTAQVMEVTGYSRDWIPGSKSSPGVTTTRMVPTLSATEDIETRVPERERERERALLTQEEHRRELSEALARPLADGGMWNSRKVAEWIEKKSGTRRVRTQRGWEYLRKLGRTPKVPRPAHATRPTRGSKREQEAFKKTSDEGGEALKEAYPTAKVELWTEDEHRLGLKPVLRKVVWSRKGERDPPSKSINATNGPTSTLSLGRIPERSTGEVHWLILPKVNVEVFSLALEHFAKEVGAGKRRRASCWCSIEPDGTRARRLRCRRAYTLSSCPRTLRSYSPPKSYGQKGYGQKGYGHLTTREWQTATSSRSKGLRRR